jgi:hypothetical protein
VKLYDAAGLAAVAWHCVTVLRRVIPPVSPDGPWIPYSAAQVAARRAAQMVACVVCIALPPTPAAAPSPVPPVPSQEIVGPPLDLVPRITPGTLPPYVTTPEPATGLMFGAGLVALWVLGGRGAPRDPRSTRPASGEDTGNGTIAAGGGGGKAQ